MDASASAKAKSGLLAFVVPVLLGVGGSLGAVSAFGSGTYDVAPMRVHMAVTAAASGTTVLSNETPAIGPLGSATADTHGSPLKISASVVGVNAAALGGAVVDKGRGQSEPLDPTDPRSVALFLAQNGKGAARSFGIKVGLLAAGGSLVGGLVGALGRPKKALAGLVAGIVVVGVIGLITQQTYDTSKFEGTRFAPADASQ